MPVKKGNANGQGTNSKLKRPKTAPEGNRGGNNERDVGTETKLRMERDEGSGGSRGPGAAGVGPGRLRRKSMLGISELGQLREEEAEQGGEGGGAGYHELLALNIVQYRRGDANESIKSTTSTGTTLSSPLASTRTSTPSLSRDSSLSTISTGGESLRTVADPEGVPDDFKILASVCGREKHQLPGAGDIFAAERQRQKQAGGTKLPFGSPLKTGAYSPSRSRVASAAGGGKDCKHADLYAEERRTNMSKWKAFLTMVGNRLAGRKG
jgi:hypothetical protein